MPAKKSSAARAKRVSKVPENESAQDKFRRLAVMRVSKALNTLKNIENLSRYAHTPEQGAKIVSTLTEAVERVESRFSQTPRSEKPKFDL